MISGEEEARAFVAARCGAGAMEQIDAYITALCDENVRQNLVSSASLEAVWQRHIADSAQLLDLVPRGTSPWLDLGSGPGLPGMVLAIMRPEEQFVLVESRRRRVEFLQSVGSSLGLGNVRVEGSRLEQVESFAAGAITARAFAPLPRLIDLSRRFSTAHTVWVLPKGRSAAQELQELPREVAKMFHVEQSKTGSDAGIVVGKLPQGTGKQR